MLRLIVYFVNMIITYAITLGQTMLQSPPEQDENRLKRCGSFLCTFFEWLPFVMSLLCFVPAILGRMGKGYPEDYYLVTHWKYQFIISVVANLCTTLPIILDNALDNFMRTVGRRYVGRSTDETITNTSPIYIPFYETVMYLAIPDLLYLFWMIPFNQIGFSLALLNARDIMYIYSLLHFLSKNSPAVWSRYSLYFVGFPAMILNVMDSYSAIYGYNDNESSLRDYLFFFVVLVMYFIGNITLFAYIFWWFRYVFSLRVDDIDTKIILSSIYAVVLLVYISVTHIGGFFKDEWNYERPITVHYLLAGCTLMLTVSSSQFARLEANNNLVALKEMFLRYISHELRTPLSTVFLGLQIARSELDRTGQSELVETIADAQQSCQVTIGILNDMLLYDRIVNGHMVLEKRKLDPADIITKTLRPFRLQVIDYLN
jgi:signal transduction histidine kinase